ncbi:MAG: NapC/NirT family cytochrome c [bacterium]|nr:NapC/NirT family cytochrome c [bacterium]
MRKLFPPIVYNPVTLVGAAIAAVSFGLIIFLFILEFFSGESNPYLGIITFIVLPSILIIGLLLIAYGIFRERRRIKRGIERSGKFIVIDLNDIKQRRVVATFTIGTLLLLLFSAFGSYKAFEYSESDEFCGKICHEVMEPEYTAYLSSPHARVGCVGCHIGSGANWFVKSKISGAYQVYSVLFNKYSKPIPTPVKELRPAEGTCEQCHSPGHFFSEIKYKSDYFLYDEANTKSTIAMLLKIGGGNSELGRAEGIHWHMNISNRIEYIHLDEKRNTIPWVKQIKSNGEEIIYKSTEIEFNEKEVPEENHRVMDCIDCHNRPSHIFNPADKSVNLSLSLDRIDKSLPYIKSIAVDVLETGYSSKEIALDSIKIFITDFYRFNYPDIFKEKSFEIEQSIKEVQKIYNRNYFPQMNVGWRAFPNHISHLYDTGCFRCHDNKHVSEDGKVIRKDCNICHTIISQVTPDGKENVSLTGIDFIHPVQIEEFIIEQECVTCHARDRKQDYYKNYQKITSK